MNRNVLVLALVLAWSLDAFAQAPFYQDKTIKIVAGYGAGSVDDAWTRMIAHFLGKHIPGNPNFIVQNMPGAGAMIAANYVYKVAKPDGLTFGGIRAGLYFDQLVGRKQVQFDWPKFTWLGTPVQAEQIIYIRANTPYKTIHDVRRTAVAPKCGAPAHLPLAIILPTSWRKPSGQSLIPSPATRTVRKSIWQSSERRFTAVVFRSKHCSVANRSSVGTKTALSESWFKQASNVIHGYPTYRPFGSS